MKVGSYDFTKSNKLYKTCKFTICNLNCNYDEKNKTWSIDLPQFFVENEADYRQIKINQFIYYTPNGSSDIGTCLHSEDLFDGEFNQPELEYFVGVSGNSINGLYTLQTRRRTLKFWFSDYINTGKRLGNTEKYIDYNDNQKEKEGEVHFFIQAQLFY